MTEDRVPTRTDRIEQLVRYVHRMREPDIVRPDEEQSIRNIANLIAEAAESAPPLDVPPSNLLAEAMHSTRTPGHDSHAIEECIDHTYSLEEWAERVYDWLARFRFAAEYARLGSAPSRSEPEEVNQ